MSIREAEADAAELLRRSWWDGPDQDWPLPVDPIRLALGLGIRIREDILPSDESGRIVMRAEGDVVISLNGLDHPNRQRFTCAHEIGHYSSRRKSGEDETFSDRRATLAGLGVSPEEIYANQFAAALLMPAHLVQRFRGEGLAVEKMARRFGTSVQAMELRIRNLGL